MNTAEVKPYVGITDISTVEDAHFVAELFKTWFSQDGSHQGMAGYIVSDRTIARLDQSDGSGATQHLVQMLETTSSSALNTLHFKTRRPGSFVPSLAKLLAYRGIWRDGLCRTIQLNLDWPNIEDIQKLKDIYPETRLILQLGQQILRDEDPVDIGIGLEAYNTLADYLIIDSSGGQGIPFDSSAIAPYFRIARHTLPNTGIVFAGGFDDNNVELRLNELHQRLRIRQFGIDAQDRLFSPSPQDYRTKILNQQKAAGYIEKAVGFFIG